MRVSVASLATDSSLIDLVSAVVLNGALRDQALELLAQLVARISLCNICLANLSVLLILAHAMHIVIRHPLVSVAR